MLEQTRILDISSLDSAPNNSDYQLFQRHEPDYIVESALSIDPIEECGIIWNKVSSA